MTSSYLPPHSSTTYKGHIAITGGRGRLAGLAASFFKEAGYEVVCFSRTPGEGLQALENLLEPVVMGSFAALFHCAWSTVPFTSESDPGREEREDLPLLKKLLESLTITAAQGAAPKLIFISSASVYGNQGEVPATEIVSCEPLGAYARGKLRAEKMIMEAAQKSPKLRTIILRVTNVIGFSSDPKHPQGILPRIIAAAKEQQSLEIWGDGRCSKDYLWISDFLLALQAAMTTSISGIFNIGSEKNFSILELGSIVEKALNTHLCVLHRNRYPWDVSRCAVDSSAFSKETGWKPCSDISREIELLLS